jgi:hypothetical protein
MNMRDLEIAKKTLYENDLTLAIVKNGRIIFPDRCPQNLGFFSCYRTKRGGVAGYRGGR